MRRVLVCSCRVLALAALAGAAVCLVPSSASAQWAGPDRDGDGLPDAWETAFGLDPDRATGRDGADGDPDGDGDTNLEEYQRRSHPFGNYRRYLAEGANSIEFQTRLALFNPGGTSTSAWLVFARASGAPITTLVPVPARTRVTVETHAVAGMADAEFSTTVESDRPLVVDRTMIWAKGLGYGGHTETSLPTPASRWYLAEGATHGTFNLFYLLQNPNDREVPVRVRYLRTSLPPLEKTYTLAPTSRTNIHVDLEQFPNGSGNRALADADLSAVIETLDGSPIIVERAMYADVPGQFLGAGHASAGVRTPATEWFLAEGATGPYFDLFVLMANPSAQAAEVDVAFLLAGGATLERSYTLAPTSRFGLWVDHLDPLLADAAVSTTVRSTNGVPIIVERAMWWPYGPGQWHEAHNSAGATTTGTRWALAEGEVDYARNLETYILVANTSATAADVTVTLFFEDGSSASRAFSAADIPARSRFNVPVGHFFPEARGRRFGAIVESVGPAPAEIVVERAIYWDAVGQHWAAGTNAIGTKLQADGTPADLPGPAVTSFGVEPLSGPAGAPVTLSWATTDAYTVAIEPGVGTGLAPSGSVTVTPTTTTTYTLTATGAGGIATATATYVVRIIEPGNNPPTVTGEEVTTDDETPVEVAVLANDVDPDGDPLAVTALGTPSSGAAVLVNGVVRYTPVVGFSGMVTIAYTVSDGRGALVNGVVAVTVTPPGLATVSSSPANGEGRVAVTRETILRFSRPLANCAQIDATKLFAQFAGVVFPTRIHRSADCRTVTLFYLNTLPASARVRVSFDGTGLVDDRGRGIDSDGDGLAGGTARIDFDTLTLTTLPGTAVTGRVFASELGDGGVNTPLAGVVVYVDGLETTLRTTTDAMGNFRLDPAPVGEFFVHVDGRSATNPVPDGAYYPFVGKKWESKAGKVTDVGNVYLPLIAPGALRPVSTTSETVVTFPASVLAANPELQGVQIVVPPDALFSDNGARGGMVGIAPVAPDRLPSPLPPGLDLPLVITVQTDGATNFDVPVPACFPNTPDKDGEPLAPGEKSALWSFNHDIGDWEIVGPMTVSDDGTLVCTDEGVGILQPGWHGQDPSSKENSDSRIGGPPPLCSYGPPAGPLSSAAVCEPSSPPAPNCNADQWADLIGDCSEFLLSAALPFVNPAAALPIWASRLAKLRVADQLIRESRIGNDDIAEMIGDGLDHTAVWQGRRQSGTISLIGWPNSYPYRFNWSTGLELAGNAFAALTGLIQLKDCLEKGGSCVGPVFDSLTGAPLLVHDAAVGDAVRGRIVGVSRAKSFFQRWNSASEAFVGVLLAGLQAELSSRLPNTDEPLVFFVDQQNYLRVYKSDGAPVLAGGTPLALRLAELLSPSIRADQSARADFARRLLDASEALQRVLSPEDPDFEYIGQAYLAAADRLRLAILSGLRNRERMQPAYRLVGGGSVTRGRAGAGGVVGAVVAPRQHYRLEVVEPVSGALSVRGVFIESAGVVKEGGPNALIVGSQADTDGDGVGDQSEEVLGTSPTNPDTDGDGLSDFAEIQQGTDPLDGVPAATGLLQSVQTPGTALDVAARNDVAVVAGGAAGVTVLNVSSGLNPVIVAQVDTPGDAKRVAFEGSLVAVADGAGGLSVVDVADPPSASIRYTVPASAAGGSVDVVIVAGNTVYAGVNGSGGGVVAYDLETGIELGRATLGGPVYDLVTERDHLYVLHGSALTAFALGIGLEVASGTVGVSGLGPEGITGVRRLFVGGGRAYVTAYPGFDTVDVTDPASMLPLSGAVDNGPNSFKHLVTNGTGLGIVAVGVNPRPDGTHHVSLYDLSDPARANRDFLTTFETPGTARSLSLYNGVAYAADGEAGLQVVNYLAFDTQGVPPTIALDSNFSLAGGGGAAEEGKLMRLTANVGDDVQVRNVEFSVNGARVATDGNFPFEHRFVTPLISQAPSFTVSACAFDTGGNRTCTAEITLTLVPDATPPRVKSVSPRNGARVAQGSLTAVSATFSEPVQAALLTSSNVQLYRAGGDGVAGTGDDVLVTGGSLAYREDTNTVVLSFPSPLPTDAYRGVVRSTVTDLVGNPMNADVTWDFRVKGAKAWVKDASGFWDDASNWSEGTLPEADDIVVIDRPGADITVTVRMATPAISRLTTTEAVVVQSLLVATTALEFNGPVTLAPGGTLGGAASMTFTAPVTWTGSTLDSPVTLYIGLGATWTVAAGATWTIDGPGGVTNVSGGTAHLINAGTMAKTGAGEWTVGIPLTNTGTLSLQGGTVNFASAGWVNQGQIAVGAGQTFRLDGATLQAGTTFGGAGSLEVTGSVVVAAPVTVTRPLTLAGGLGGAGAVTFTAPVTWTGSTLDSPVTEAPYPTATFTATAPLTLSGGAAKGLARRAVVVEGAVTSSGGPLYIGLGATWTVAAGATWTVTAPWQMVNPYGGQAGLTNAGLLTRVGSSGPVDIGIPFTNTGTLRVRFGGTAVGEFDLWNVANATLGGTLDVQLINGFTPASGNTFDVITGTYTGTFGTLTGNGETYTLSYPPGIVRVTKP